MQLKANLVIFFLLSVFVSNSQKLFEAQINVSTGGKVDKRDAVIYLPHGYSKDKAYPLVLFSHGMGEAGNNVKKLYKQGLPRVLKQGYRPSFDFIMVAVQRNSFSLPPDWLPGILEDCLKRWKIDQSRIYLTGLSAGGWSVYGSQLNISPTFAKKFAAIVINSAVTHNTKKENFDWWKTTKTPLWAIVGAADKGYVGKNEYMVREINKRVPNLATLTVRPGVGHGGWSDVYGGKLKLKGRNMWEWLYQFKRTGNGSSNGGGNNDNDDDDDNDGDDDDDDNGKPDPIPTTPGNTTRYVKINIFSGADAYRNGSWHNWNVGTNPKNNVTTGALDYSNENPSSIRAVLSSTHRVVDNGATYGSGIAPAEVLRHTSYSAANRTLTISGLSSSKKYAIELFGSRRKNPHDATRFRIGNQSRTVKTYKNLSEFAKFKDIVPDANGRIVVKIESVKTYNYLNGFAIVESNR